MGIGWALIQYDWCPHKKGMFGHREAHTGRMPCEDQNYVAPSQGATRNWDRNLEQILSSTFRGSMACRHLDLRLLASRIWDNTFLWFEPLNLWILVTAAVANSYTDYHFLAMMGLWVDTQSLWLAVQFTPSSQYQDALFPKVKSSQKNLDRLQRLGVGGDLKTQGYFYFVFFKYPK